MRIGENGRWTNLPMSEAEARQKVVALACAGLLWTGAQHLDLSRGQCACTLCRRRSARRTQ